jgi:hypothetical protein
MEYPKAVIKKCIKDDDVIEIDEGRLINVGIDDYDFYRDYLSYPKGHIVCYRSHGGNFKNQSFALAKEFDWVIVNDDTGCLCLIPLKKEDDC